VIAHDARCAREVRKGHGCDALSGFAKAARRISPFSCSLPGSALFPWNTFSTFLPSTVLLGLTKVDFGMSRLRIWSSKMASAILNEAEEHYWCLGSNYFLGLTCSRSQNLELAIIAERTIMVAARRIITFPSVKSNPTNMHC
jgi:hypothetical protein